MRVRGFLLGLILALLPGAALAQSATYANLFVLETGPCTLRSGSGTPEGAVTGKVCDTFWRTDTGTIYTKQSGTGNTGWVLIAGVTGSGTTNTLPKWTASTVLGDSSIADTSGAVSVGGTTFSLAGSGAATLNPGSTITISGTGNLTLSPSGDIITAPAGLDVLPGAAYTVRLGAPTLQYLSLDVAELHAQTLVAQDVIATIGGIVDVAPTTQLIAPLTAVATTMDVKHNEMASGDRVFMKASPGGIPQFEAFAVTSGPTTITGGFRYTVTRNLDGTGANAWNAGDAVLNTGTTGDGLLELYSTSNVFGGGSGPSMVGSVRTSSTYNALSPRFIVGNLNGYYGYGAATYGIAAGDASGTFITAEATNGFRIKNYVGTTIFQADTSGNLNLAGAINLGTSGYGYIKSNAVTAANSGAQGFWMDSNGAFRVGNPSGNELYWDGLTLIVKGDGSGVTNINGGAIQTNTINVGSINATGIGDNLVRNGFFENSGLDAWSLIPNYVGSSSVTLNVGQGDNGPGAMYMFVNTNSAATATSAAFPVRYGATYTVSVDVKNVTGASVSGGWDIFIGESDDNISNASYVDAFFGAGPPFAHYESYIGVGIGSLPYTNTWVTKTITYTPSAPSGSNALADTARWASIIIRSTTGTACTSSGLPPCPAFATGTLFDNVRVQEQIGAGRIIANSITAGQIATDTLTATQIAAGAITTSELATGSVTTAKIVAGNVTTNELGALAVTTAKLDSLAVTTAKLDAGAVTAAKIAANTITAGQIQAGTITATEIHGGTIDASKLVAHTITTTEIATGGVTAGNINVSTLSAITANLGTVTAGAISGVTITGGSGGEVVIDSNGITVGAGTGFRNGYKFSDGAGVYSNGSGVTRITSGGGNISIDASHTFSFTSLSGVTGAGTRYLCVDAVGQVYAATGC